MNKEMKVYDDLILLLDDNNDSFDYNAKNNGHSVFNQNNDPFVSLDLPKLINSNKNPIGDQYQSYLHEKDRIISERLDYLSYGFSVRTKSTLESTYIWTRSLMGEENWNYLGREFSDIYSRKTNNLNLIGLDFPKFLKDRIASGYKFNDTESNIEEPRFYICLAELECLMMEISLLKRERGMEKEEISGLQENDSVFVRNDVRLFSGNLQMTEDTWKYDSELNYYLLFRNNKSNDSNITILPVSQEIYSLLQNISGKSISGISKDYPEELIIRVLSILGLHELILSNQYNQGLR